MYLDDVKIFTKNKEEMKTRMSNIKWEFVIAIIIMN